MRNLIFVVIMLSLVGCQCQKKGAPEEYIRVGAILPLTLDAAQAGINTKKGIDLAVELANSNGGINGKKINVIYEDTKADPKTGVSAIQKLISLDRVNYIIDNSISSVTLAVAPIAEQNKVVLMSTGGSSPKISEAGNFIFRIWNSDDLEGSVMASFILDSMKMKRIAILYSNNEYGNGLNQVFRKSFIKKRIEIPSYSFDESSLNFQTILVKALSGNPEGIYIICYPTSYIKIVNQLKVLNYKGDLIGTSISSDPNVYETIKKLKYKLYYPTPISPDTANRSSQFFIENYRKKYAEFPPGLADVGFDAINLFLEALKNGKGEDGESLRNGLSKTKYFGASGEIVFDENGDVHKPIKINLLNTNK